MKACHQCDRKFHKMEHLLRHSRSHTGEKPFPCPHCDRRYGRSDVLRRHVKSMHENLANPAAPRGSDSRANSRATATDRSSTSNRNSQSAPVLQDATAARMDDCLVPDEAPAFHSHLNHAEISPAVQLDKFLSASMLQARETPMSHQNLSLGSNEAEYPEDIPINRGLVPFSDASGPLRPEYRHSQFLLNQTPDERERIRPSRQQSPVDAVDYSQISMMNSEVENASSHCFQMNNALHDLEPYLGGDTFSFLHGSESTMPPSMGLPLPSLPPATAPGSKASSEDHMDSVTAERFALVSRLWPGRRSSFDCGFTHDLWKELVMLREGDVILGSLHASPNEPPHIEWGLNDHQQQELMREFAPGSSGEQWRHSSPNPAFDSSLAFDPDFPSTRLLNLGLFTAFKQTHGLLHFLHQPTFVARSAPKSLVFSLCLLGFVRLAADKTKEYLNKYLPIATQKCCAQLAEPNFDPADPMRLFSRLSTATLLLYATSIHPGQNRQETHMSQMLYHQTIMVAQLSGLFRPHSSLPTTTELINEGQATTRLHTDIESGDDLRWRLWARVESMKRLVTSLIVTDSWWSYKLGTTPVVSTQAVRYDLPCSEELYRSPSARSWKRLVDENDGIDNEPILIQLHTPWVALRPSCCVSPAGMFGLLSIIWIRMLNMRQRMIPPWPVAAEQGKRLILPVAMYMVDESGQTLTDGLLDIYKTHIQFLQDGNPHCVILWHFLNLQLLVNVEILESAIGRYGVENAYTALPFITAWSKTSSARRACLHAAGIYKAMNRRRINDGIIIHTESAGFHAALVMALYGFVVQSSEHQDTGSQRNPTRGPNGDAEPYEVLDDVDWPALGLMGLEPPSEMATTGNGPTSPAQSFIENSSPLSFMGTVLNGGYDSAQMILLEYANLLGDLGEGTSEGLGRVLRIMSNSLVDMELNNPPQRNASGT